MAVSGLLIDRVVLYRAPWNNEGQVEGIVWRICSRSFDPAIIPNQVLDVPLTLLDADLLRSGLGQRVESVGVLRPGMGGDVTEEPDRRAAMSSEDLAGLSQAEVGVVHPSALVVHPVNINQSTGSRIVPVSIVWTLDGTNRVLVGVLHLYDLPAVYKVLDHLIKELEAGA